MIKLMSLIREIEYPLASKEDQQNFTGYEGWKAKLIWMTPDKFLHLAPPLPDYAMNEKSYWDLRKRMKEKLPLDFLVLTVNPKTKKVTSHEGRHRAKVAKELGVEKIPVLIWVTEPYPRVPKWGKKEHDFVNAADFIPQWKG